ncbi:bifunctional diaminohydroxyphosphoribosylaminopyrimidine deaminase/5-amino-6-(5-phosphoribosylamino)uracil reductase RibD [Granulicella sp. L46]|jgi:diaminohydroxyphosphoribosylaminopyrimidine deaminase/5-amino-6-(5-phosphoribosylamino)uracil reductase|uniref:bifunctional diaminohydroxyphosphoribosylaminopyrimidine deaminase/5-amino-6-(5-phosphoribosylamino)uracil reductase RibD n=1 Tax=Granulicella sp. L46 TaxID=1641865 RepID=UPI00131B0578|nr:bifunctional diaminohydroxyphosphoribosylaminopyrimidine deaminase/5-amino-6-(5-phosphoribosylamino)uracil reductase RibD [Granulicella sp. L46]
MSFTSQDELNLTRALTLAREAAAFASPNPTVGSVLTRDDVILGEGAHFYDARDHAEISALKQAAALGNNVHGATSYVTLEPCAHHGRTGPCADALIAAGIARCVVATVDPNPLVSGQGLAKLRAANIEVVLLDPAHPIAQQARHLNDAFAHFIQHHHPFITLKAALSVDGKLAPPPSTRTSTTPHWVTGTAARADAQLLRQASDAILTGIGTVLADNPSLTDRTGLPRRRPLLRVILDSALRTPPDSALVRNAASELLILCSDDTTQAPTDRESALRARTAEVLRIPTIHGHLDLNAALKALAERHILSVLVEAGSTLNGNLLRANLVDRLVLYYAESELGLDALPFATGFDSPYGLQQRLTRATRATFPSHLAPNAEDVRIAGYLHDPWANISNP